MGGWSGFLGRKGFWQQSKIERMLRFVLSDCFGCNVSLAQDRVVGASGKRWRVDFLSPNDHLIIEYDGFYYHQDKAYKDRIKSEDIKNATPGWTVIRVRGNPLSLVDPLLDVKVNESSGPAAQITTVLQHLLKLDENSVSMRAEVKKSINDWLDGRLITFDFHTVLVGLDGYRPFEEARDWAVKQGIKTKEQWIEKCRERGWLPVDIPRAPNAVYRAAFSAHGGWGGFLGTNAVAPQLREYRSLDAASEWAIKQSLSSRSHWAQKCKEPGWLPADIPRAPDLVYDSKAFRDKGGWGGFLGTGTLAPSMHNFRSLTEAAAWAQQQGVSSQAEWIEKCRIPGWRPIDIPAGPARAYGSDFSAMGGWGGFLGTGRIANKLRRRP